jgi:hypothetical protein
VGLQEHPENQTGADVLDGEDVARRPAAGASAVTRRALISGRCLSSSPVSRHVFDIASVDQRDKALIDIEECVPAVQRMRPRLFDLINDSLQSMQVLNGRFVQDSLGFHR